MTFDPNAHLRNLKGQSYLDVKWRLVWLAEECKNYRVTTELIKYIEQEKMWVFKARVDIFDEHGAIQKSAESTGQETERDFPSGPCEKAETKAIGRALALLGFGTQFALELDEGERVVDSPVQQARPARSAQAGLKVVADRPATAPDQTTLRDEVTTGLAADPDAAAKLPKEASAMTAEELEKTLVWLRNRATRRESAQGSGVADASAEAAATDSFSVARDKRAAFARQITEVVVSDLNALASAIVASHDQGDVVTSAQGKEMLECVDLAQCALEAQRAGQLAQVELTIGQAKKSAQIGADFYDALIALTRRVRTERVWTTGEPAPATTRAVAS